MTMPRPRTIIYGVVCMAVSLVIGSYILAFQWKELEIGIYCFVIVGSLTACAWFWGWARWVIAFLAVSSVVLTWSIVSFQLSFRILLPVLTSTQFALEITGFVLLFHPHSTRWYRHKRTAGSPTADPGAAPRG